MTIKVEVSGAPDVQTLAAIHNRCFPKGWDADAVRDLLAVTGTLAFLAEAAGFALLRHAGDDAEVLTLAVLPERRKGGIGAALVNAMCARAGAQGANALFLEVAERNEAARKLYEKCGFSIISRRKEYYREPDGSHDHALVMRRTLQA